MKTLFMLATAGVMVSSLAYAQNGQPQQYELVVPQEFQQDPNMAAQDGARPSQAGAGVVILNSQTASGTSSAEAKTRSVLKNQPTTYVEASPLVESRAEQMRKQRQQAELNTEQRIVEKLEQSRLEDEKDRAARLFGGKFTKPTQPQQPAPQVYGQQGQQPQYPPVVAVKVVEDDESSAKAEAEEARKAEIDELRQEIRDAVKESNQTRVKQNFDDYKAKPKQKSNMGVLLGAGDYNASNIEANGALGFTIGSYIDDHFSVEGSFLYSNYQLDEYWRRDFYKEIDQYDFSLGAKYSVLPGRIKPFVAGNVTYIYRNYTDRTDEFFGDNDFDNETVTSSAVNAGFGVGLDFFVNERFSVGFEYRYSLNVYNNSDSDFLSREDFREPSNTEPVEEIEYSTMAFTSKLVF